eukprot:TRINITY_DN554_c0_g2_i1.p1 TRINITY_DN554_c0_g2~~TRINITY_DN554_c0_g2_i1.p1  ORF type:complete len:627 (+),score=91.74 TRINITY_DN554_c0_g2_i1:68-1882(+)
MPSPFVSADGELYWDDGYGSPSVELPFGDQLSPVSEQEGQLVPDVVSSELMNLAVGDPANYDRLVSASIPAPVAPPTMEEYLLRKGLQVTNTTDSSNHIDEQKPILPDGGTYLQSDNSNRDNTESLPLPLAVPTTVAKQTRSNASSQGINSTRNQTLEAPIPLSESYLLPTESYQPSTKPITTTDLTQYLQHERVDHFQSHQSLSHSQDGNYMHRVTAPKNREAAYRRSSDTSLCSEPMKQYPQPVDRRSSFNNRDCDLYRYQPQPQPTLSEYVSDGGVVNFVPSIDGCNYLPVSASDYVRAVCRRNSDTSTSLSSEPMRRFGAESQQSRHSNTESRMATRPSQGCEHCTGKGINTTPIVGYTHSSVGVNIPVLSTSASVIGMRPTGAFDNTTKPLRFIDVPSVELTSSQLGSIMKECFTGGAYDQIAYHAAVAATALLAVASVRPPSKKVRSSFIGKAISFPTPTPQRPHRNRRNSTSGSSCRSSLSAVSDLSTIFKECLTGGVYDLISVHSVVAALAIAVVAPVQPRRSKSKKHRNGFVGRSITFSSPIARTVVSPKANRRDVSPTRLRDFDSGIPATLSAHEAKYMVENYAAAGMPVTDLL